MYFSKADQEVKINFLTGFIFVESLLLPAGHSH